jgi:hypothetical protein
VIPQYYTEEQQQNEVPQFATGTRRPEQGLELFTKRTDPEDVLRRYFRDVIGVNIKRTENGNLVYVPGKKPLMNLEGSQKLYVILSPFFNTVTSLTQWNEEEISNTLLFTMEDVAKFLWDENKEIGLSDEMLMPTAVGIRNFLHAQLNKSKDGFENKQISVMQQRQELIERERPDKRGFIDKITGRNKEHAQGGAPQ